MAARLSGSPGSAALLLVTSRGGLKVGIGFSAGGFWFGVWLATGVGQDGSFGSKGLVGVWSLEEGGDDIELVAKASLNLLDGAGFARGLVIGEELLLSGFWLLLSMAVLQILVYRKIQVFVNATS